MDGPSIPWTQEMHDLYQLLMEIGTRHEPSHPPWHCASNAIWTACQKTTIQSARAHVRLMQAMSERQYYEVARLRHERRRMDQWRSMGGDATGTKVTIKAESVTKV
jgi:hypothetical protein